MILAQRMDQDDQRESADIRPRVACRRLICRAAVNRKTSASGGNAPVAGPMIARLIIVRTSVSCRSRGLHNHSDRGFPAVRPAKRQNVRLLVGPTSFMVTHVLAPNASGFGLDRVITSATSLPFSQVLYAAFRQHLRRPLSAGGSPGPFISRLAFAPVHSPVAQTGRSRVPASARDCSLLLQSTASLEFDGINHLLRPRHG